MVNEKPSCSSAPGGSAGPSLEDLCEIVLSYKCRHCAFLCQEKSEFVAHLNDHSNGGGSATTATDSKREQVTKIESCTPVPSIPPTPEAFIVEDDLDDDQEEEGGAFDKTGEFGEEGGIADVFLCAECDVVFSSKELCCRHMHDVHQLVQFNAEFIQKEIIAKKKSRKDKSTKRKTKMPRHLTREEGVIVPKRYRVRKEVFFTCSKCPVRFESEEVMRFHEQCHTDDIHPKVGQGSGETEESRDGETMDDEDQEEEGRQLRRGKKVSRFSCPVCDSKGTPALYQKWGLCAGHLWREHKIDCELYTCTVCKKFKSHLITRVTEHEQLHQTDVIFTCKTCNKRFKQQKQLRTHEKYHREKMTVLPPPEESRWYTPKECPICKRILSDAKCLKKHISAVHNKLKPYNCNICGHMTARKAELQLHVRQHTGEKPYKCTMCSFATGDHNSLRKHKLRHSDKRPYSCPYCEYKCIQSCAFKKHIVSFHKGQDVVYLCQLCSHASVNETLFAAHQKDHEEGRIPQSISSHPQSQTNDRSNENDQDTTGSLDSVSPTKSTKPKSPRKPRWLEEDSVDVIDTGGVTIPASPATSDPQSIHEDEDSNDKLATVHVPPPEELEESEEDEQEDEDAENPGALTVDLSELRSITGSSTTTNSSDTSTNSGEKSIALTSTNAVTPTATTSNSGKTATSHPTTTTYILLPPNTPMTTPISFIMPQNAQPATTPSSSGNTATPVVDKSSSSTS